MAELAVPSDTDTEKAGAASSPLWANWTKPALSWVLVKELTALPGALLSWKMPPLTADTV